MHGIEEHEASFGVIAETRCTSSEQRWISNAYRSRGWSTAWSEAVSLDGRQGRTGGAAVLASADWTQVSNVIDVQLKAPATNYVISTWQSHSCRQHAIVVAYYGHPSDPRATERDVASLCAALMAHEEYIILIAGDFNTNVREQQYTPYGFLDVHESIAIQSEQTLHNTCFTPNGEARPDRIYMPERQWGSLQAASAHHDSSLATHCPLVVTLTRERYRALCQSPARAICTRPVGGDFPVGVSTFDEWSDGWALWLTGGEKQKHKKPRSCGVPVTEEEITWTRATTSRWIRRLRNFTAQVVALRRMKDKGGQMAQALWAKITRNAKPFLERHGTPQTWGCANTPEEVTDEVLQSLQLHLQKVIREQLKHDGRDRGQKYRQALNEYGGVNRKVSRLLREGSSQPLLSIKQGDIILTNADEIFEALRRAWHPYHEQEEVQAGDRLEQWLAPLPQYAYELGPNDPQFMAAAVQSMGPSTSTGSDAWPIRELKQLPQEAWQQLCMIMDEVEQSGHWPESQRKVWLSTLAKTPLACLPHKVRPIAILPSTYRVWAKARFQQLKPWLEHVLAPCMYAYRPHRDALQVGMELARALEKAKHRALHQPYGWMIASLDCTKAFPSIPRSTLWRILRRMQCPERLVATMEQYYRVTQATWRLRGRIVSRFCWTPLRGVYQGCPISVALFNCLLLPLALRLQEETPEVIPHFYADDITLSSDNAEQLTAASTAVQGVLRVAEHRAQPLQDPVPEHWQRPRQHCRRWAAHQKAGGHYCCWHTPVRHRGCHWT